MMSEQTGRSQSSADPEILIFSIMILTLVVGAEGILFGLGLDKAALVAEQVQRPVRQLLFFKWYAALIVSVIAVNAAIGASIARRLSTPLNRVKRAMSEIARGNLEQELAPGSGEMLQSYTEECENMLATLRRLIYRDHKSAIEATEMLAQCEKLLCEKSDGRRGDPKEIHELLNAARSQLSVINYHFLKGLQQEP